MSHQPKILILYIEDNSDNRKLVSRLLTAFDYDIRTAASGQEGLDFVVDQVPDLILMDISMPHMDGYTVTKQMRKLAKLKNTPIIALTANVMKGDQEKTLAAGCDGYIPKPIDIDTFPEQLVKFLQPKTQS